MKVLHINCNYLGSKLHRVMIGHFKDKCIDHEVFVPTYLDNAEDLGKNVHIARCFKKWDRLCFQYKQRKIRNALESMVDLEKIDLMHAYTVFTDGNVAYEMKKKYGIPYVVAVRNTDVNSFFKYMVHLRSKGVSILKNARAIFFLSKTYKEKVFNKYIPKELKNELEKKSYIIPNGIDEFWHKNKLEDTKKDIHNPVRIMYAGVIDKNKNITATQKALEIIRKQGIELEFTVVGNVKDKKVFSEVTKDKYTKYIEACSKEELIKIYRDNDIFVMPSFHETFGLVYVEAMSQGLPVIYTKNEGFDGQFEDGEVGFAVNPYDAKEISEKIMECINNYSNYNFKLSIDVERYKWESICKMYICIYKEICIVS